MNIVIPRTDKLVFSKYSSRFPTMNIAIEPTDESKRMRGRKTRTLIHIAIARTDKYDVILYKTITIIVVYVL